jgi:hypothetical protein
VDLLITVDSAFGPASEWDSVTILRQVAPCVRRNLNFYQTTRKGRVKSCGGTNLAMNPQKTKVENHDMTKTADHASIDKVTMPDALDAIRRALGAQAVPPLFPKGVMPA